MTLRLEHQSLPGGFVEQGTFLPAAIVEEINAMKDRTELNECSQAIKAAFFELDVMKKELGQQEETRGRTSLRKSLHHMAAGRNRNRVQQSIHALRDAIDVRARVQGRLRVLALWPGQRGVEAHDQLVLVHHWPG